MALDIGIVIEDEFLRGAVYKSAKTWPQLSDSWDADANGMPCPTLDEIKAKEASSLAKQATKTARPTNAECLAALMAHAVAPTQGTADALAALKTREDAFKAL